MFRNNHGFFHDEELLSAEIFSEKCPLDFNSSRGFQFCFQTKSYKLNIRPSAYFSKQKNGDFLKIEQLDDKTVRILLTAEDMEHLDLTYDEMDYSNNITKRAVYLILQQIKAQTSLMLDEHRLFIEAFPDSNGGCILYLNLIEKNTGPRPQRERYSFDTPMVFGFETLDILTAVCNRLVREFSHLIVKTELYLYEREYRLLLYTYCKMEERILHLLREYGTYLGKGSVLCAFTKEHARPLLTENAIETIVQYLD